MLLERFRWFHICFACFIWHNELLFVHLITKKYNLISIIRKSWKFFTQFFWDFAQILTNQKCWECAWTPDTPGSYTIAGLREGNQIRNTYFLLHINNGRYSDQDKILAEKRLPTTLNISYERLRESIYGVCMNEKQKGKKKWKVPEMLTWIGCLALSFGHKRSHHQSKTM